jgi:Domain of unknown function (DUF4160)
MPRLCYLDGIVIWINTRDHEPPHFHARHAGDEIRVEIETLNVMTGQLTPTKQRKLLRWAAAHKPSLCETGIWLARACRTSQSPRP